MAEGDGEEALAEGAGGDAQVGVAEGGGLDADEDLAARGLGDGEVLDLDLIGLRRGECV